MNKSNEKSKCLQSTYFEFADKQLFHKTAVETFHISLF